MAKQNIIRAVTFLVLLLLVGHALLAATHGLVIGPVFGVSRSLLSQMPLLPLPQLPLPQLSQLPQLRPVPLGCSKEDQGLGFGTAAHATACGLDPGDLLFYCDPRLALENAFGWDRTPHLLKYCGDVSGDGVGRCVHLGPSSLRMCRLSSMWSGARGKASITLVRKLRCSSQQRATLVQVCAAACASQRSQKTGVQYNPAWTQRGAQHLFGLRDTPALGLTCTNMALLLLFDSGILIVHIQHFMTPRFLLFSSKLPFAEGCSLDSAARAIVF